MLFALANAGGSVAYSPLLTLLLPAKMALLAGDARVEWLGIATLAGALAASVANIAFGWASDLTGTRRRWASIGLVLTMASYGPLCLATSPGAMVMALIIFQTVVNMLLSPIMAWAAEAVPDHRKGLLGGLMGAGAPVGALAGIVATFPSLPDDRARLVVVGAIVITLTAPLLLLSETPRTDPPTPGLPRARTGRSDLILLLLARLLAQIAGALLFSYLLYYFQGLPGAPSQGDVARLSALGLGMSFPISLLFGRLSDRVGPRMPFLVAAAILAALGLLLMAARPSLASASYGYLLFGCGNAVFLALLSGHAMQLLPSPTRRGRDLGVLNLGNTLPSVIAPLLAIHLVPRHDFAPLLSGLAGAMLLAAGCLLLVRRPPRPS